MLTILPFVNVVLLMLLCYGASFALVGWWVTRGRRSPHPDGQIRADIRELLSKQVLELVEQGEELTVLRLMEQCPPAFHQGRLWRLWAQESHRMAMNWIEDGPLAQDQIIPMHDGLRSHVSQ